MNVTDADTIALVHAYRDQGRSKRNVAKELALDYNTVRKWWIANAPVIQWEEIGDLKSLQCGFESHSGHQRQYVYVLGLYLGDGYINLQVPKYGVYKLRITQTSKYVGLIQEHRTALGVIFPNNKTHVVKHRSKSVDVYVYSKKVPLLFPHLGVGLKHKRHITLTDWQQRLVTKYPHEFLRGLIQSDGCRYVQKQGMRQYVRYNFTNTSVDIVRLFKETCDCLGIHYTTHSRPTQSPTNPNAVTGSIKTTITINRRNCVAILDTFVGPKH